MKLSTKELAKGRWDGILSALLADKKALSRKHGPCPACGGKDRYRYDDKTGDGEWICNVCGAGDGFALLMRVNGWDFATAAAEVDKIVGNIEPQIFKPQTDVEYRRQILNKIWREAAEPELVQQYLELRGLDWSAIKNHVGDVRGTKKLLDKENSGMTPRSGVVALIRNHAGDPISIHRTFFKTEHLESVKKIMPPIEELRGAVIRLGWEDNVSTLVIGEGIETTLAGCQMFSCPGAAAISANNLALYQPPGSVKHAIILADNDLSFTGQKVAFELAYHLRNVRKIRTMVVMPETTGWDLCDLIKHGGNPQTWRGGDPNAAK